MMLSIIWAVGCFTSALLMMGGTMARVIPPVIPFTKLAPAVLAWPFAMIRMMGAIKHIEAVPTDQFWRVMLCRYFGLEPIRGINDQGFYMVIAANYYKNDPFWENGVHVLETSDKHGSVLLLPEGKVKLQSDHGDQVMRKWAPVSSISHKIYGGEVPTYKGDHLPRPTRIGQDDSDPYEQGDSEERWDGDPY